MTSLVLVDQVRQLLVDDPENSEYVDMEKELIEVIYSYDCLFVVGSLFSCRFSLEMIAQCLYGFIFPFCVVYCSYGLYSCLEENGQPFLSLWVTNQLMVLIFRCLGRCCYLSV